MKQNSMEHIVEVTDLEEGFQKNCEKSPADHDRIQRKIKSFLDELEQSTPKNPKDSIQELVRTYTKEELEDLYANDPGYVNERVMKQLPGGKKLDTDRGVLSPDGPYMQFGLHDDLTDWHADAVEGTEKETVLQPGKRVERWGSEEGRYLTEEGTEFDDLHLNVSKDKLEKTVYEVVEPIDVTESVIANQPFDEESDNRKGNAKQYRCNICIGDLVDMGKLKRVEEEK